MPRPLVCAVLLTALLALSACSDDGTTPETAATTVQGTVTDVVTAAPLAGADVVLLDGGFQVLATATTTPDGAFSFTDLEPGRRLLYALDPVYVDYDPAGAAITVESGKTLTVDLLLMDIRPYELVEHTVSGRITDAVTGEPVPGAWLAAMGLAEAGNTIRYLAGGSHTYQTVSAPDGTYVLPVWGVRENGVGDVVGLSPVSCGALGYRPRTLVGQDVDAAFEPWMPGDLLPPPAAGDTNLVVDIVLEPVPEGGLAADQVGTLRGRLVHGGEPQAGVWVGATLIALADRDTVPPPDKVAVHGGSVLSGADGSFVMTLEPGFYGMYGGWLPDDGWCGVNRPADLEITAGGTTDVGDLTLIAAVSNLLPADGAAVHTGTPRLSWDPVPGADRYRLSIGFDTYRQDMDIFTTETQWDWPAPYLLDDGTRVRWKVYAEQDQNMFYENIAWSEVPLTFIVRIPEPEPAD